MLRKKATKFAVLIAVAVAPSLALQKSDWWGTGTLTEIKVKGQSYEYSIANASCVLVGVSQRKLHVGKGQEVRYSLSDDDMFIMDSDSKLQRLRFVLQRLLAPPLIVPVDDTRQRSGGSNSLISGKITDSLGAAITRARLLVHWDPSGSNVGLTDNVGTKQDIVAVTDGRGRYSASVPPGFYDVFVSATAFTPAAAKIRVKQGQYATFSAKLKPDPLVTQELGDMFPARKQ